MYLYIQEQFKPQCNCSFRTINIPANLS